MKLAFVPVSIASGLLAGQISKKVFDLIWGRIEDQEAPRPKHREIDVRKLTLALIIEGALFRVVKGLADHASRHGFEKATGSWPGEDRPEPA